MKKILLVGQGGYLGTNFERYMKKYPEYIITTVSSMNREWEKVSFAEYDCVYNVSGLAHANARKGSDELYYEVNGKLPIEIAKKAKKEGVKQFINMSSMIVYGDFSKLYKEKIITEGTIPSMPTIYGKSKMMAEKGLEKLCSADFAIASIRPPLIYGEEAKDNFPRLVRFAMKSPIFPNLTNKQSMIYIDNLCELIKLIIDNQSSGIFYPQEPEYIETSKLVSDIAKISGHKILLTKIFNPFLVLFQYFINFIHKALGSMVYEKKMSDHFDWKYCKISYEESLVRIVENINKEKEGNEKNG